MITHNVTQGSPEWLALRTDYDTASELPIVMGCGRITREELLRMKVTGYTPEYSNFTLQLFEEGHRTEAMARPIIEALIGEELYPVTGSLEGTRLMASYDGMDMGESMSMEHKLWNEGYAEACRAKNPPPIIYWQLEQQIAVGKLDHALWVVSDGTEENMERMEYRAVPGRWEQALAAWKQFNEDRANYKHQEIPAEPVRKVIPPLPVLVLDFDGKVTVKSNVDAFKAVVLARIDAVRMDLLTDQDFDDAKADVKFLKEDVEDALEAALTQFLKKGESVQLVIDAVRELQAKSKAKRLPLSKAVETQRIAVIAKIREQYMAEWAAHVKTLNDSLSTKQAMLPEVVVDIEAAMKGKKLLQSMHDACKQAVANGKLALGDAFARVSANMAMFREKAAKHAFLFQDVKAVCNLDPVAADAVVAQRIATHEAEQKTLRDKEAQEIEDALVTSLWANARRIEGDSVAYIQKAIGAFETAARDWENDPRPRVKDTVAAARAEMKGKLDAAELAQRNAEAKALDQVAAPDANDKNPMDAPTIYQEVANSASYQFSRPAPARIAAAAAALSPETQASPGLNIGKINAILCAGKPGLTVTAEFLTSIGCPPAKTERNSSLYYDRQILAIVEQLGQHLSAVWASEKAKFKVAA